MLGHRLSHFRKFLRNLNHHLGHHTSCHIGPALGSLFLAHSWRFVQHESHTQTGTLNTWNRANASEKLFKEYGCLCIRWVLRNGQSDAHRQQMAGIEAKIYGLQPNKTLE